MPENKTFSITMSNIELKKEAMNIVSKNQIYLLSKEIDNGTDNRTTLGKSLSHILKFYNDNFLKNWLEENNFGKRE